MKTPRLLLLTLSLLAALALAACGPNSSAPTELTSEAVPTFYLGLPPSPIVVSQGESRNLKIIVLGAAGFTSPVTLSLEGPVPSGVQASFSVNEVTNTMKGSVLTLTVANTVTPGSYDLIVRGTSGNLTKTAPLTLVVSSASFSVTAASTALQVPENRIVELQVSVKRASDFTTPIVFSLEGAPNEMKAAFSPNPSSPNNVVAENVTLRLHIGDPSQNTFNLTIKAKAGDIEKTIPLSLTVTDRIDANAPGSLDTSFGAGGFVTLDLSGDRNIITAFTVQSDNKIVAVGRNEDIPSSGNFIVVRLNPDGSPDFSFDGDGRMFIDFGGSDDPTAVALQSDGKIVVAGRSVEDGGADVNLAVARINPNGSLDNSFHGDGKVLTDTGVNLEQPDFGSLNNVLLTLQSGKIVVAARDQGANLGPQMVMVRYNSDGNLDATFGSSGMVFDSDIRLLNALFLLPDGKLLAVETSSPRKIIRFHPNGQRDTSFVNGSSLNFFIYDVLLQGDKLIGTGTDFRVTRLNSNASLDTSFGLNGVADAGFTVNSRLALALAAQADGKLLAAGHLTSSIALARFSSNGNLDTGFGAGGRVTMDFPFVSANADISRAEKVAVQGDGKIILAGAARTDTGDLEFAFVRYHP